MRVKVLGSSSKGNCYILEGATESLVIEAGVNARSVRSATMMADRRVSGCVVTHRHADHASSVREMAAYGIRVLAPRDVIVSMVSKNGSWPSDMCTEAVPGRGYILDGYRIVPFEASHDVPCLGYLIHHAECGWILFATDTYTMPPAFDRLSHVMIECNYSDEALERAIDEGRTSASQRDRLMLSHMSLGTCVRYLKSVSLSGVGSVTLLHLSAENSDGKAFVAAVECATGKITRVATQGLEYEI